MPTNSMLYFTNDPKVSHIEIFSIEGNLISKLDFTNIEREYIDVGNFKKGTYLLKMISKRSMSVQKFIKY
jgi:hypothetical protein